VAFKKPYRDAAFKNLDVAMPKPLLSDGFCSAESSLSSSSSYSGLDMDCLGKNRVGGSYFNVRGLSAVNSKSVSEGEDSLKGTIVSRDRSMSEGSMSTITIDGQQLEEDMGMLWGEEHNWRQEGNRTTTQTNRNNIGTRNRNMQQEHAIAVVSATDILESLTPREVSQVIR
jgi:hypothetical protein